MLRRGVLGAVLLAALLAAGCTNGREPRGGGPTPGDSVTARDAAAVPEARTEVGAGRLGDTIVVLGGLRADGTATDRVDLYDLDSGTWAAGPALPTPLHHAGVATFGGRVVVAGGYTPGVEGAWRESDRVWSLGPSDREWRAEPSLSAPRGALALAATADRLVALGGTSAGQAVATVEQLLAGAGAWRTAPPMFQAREHLATAVRGGRVYAIGGRVGGLETNLAAVESFSPGAFSPEWRHEPDLGTPRGGIDADTVADRVCVAGGEATTGTIATVECLTGGAWAEVARLAEPRHGLGVVTGRAGELHVLGGGPQPGLFVSTAHEVLVFP